MNPVDDVKDVLDGGGIKPSTWLHLACYASLLLVVGILVKSWSDERVGRAVAESSSQTEKIVRAQAKTELDKQVADLKAEIAQVKTTPQAVKVIERYVPQAAPVVVQKAELPASVTEKLPDSPDFTIRSQPQEIALAQTVTAFEVCKATLQTCQNATASLTRERDQWKIAAKGGTKWQRFKSAMKYIGIGVGVGLALRR